MLSHRRTKNTGVEFSGYVEGKQKDELLVVGSIVNEEDPVIYLTGKDSVLNKVNKKLSSYKVEIKKEE